MNFAVCLRTDFYGPRTEYRLLHLGDSWPAAHAIASQHARRLITRLGAYQVDVVVLPESKPGAPESIALADADGRTIWVRDPDADDATAISDADKHAIADDVDAGV